MAEPAAPPPAAGGGFDIRRIMLLGGVGIVIVVAAFFLIFRGCAPVVRGGDNNVVIYSNLDLKDAANVIARLKELAIPYEIKDEGRAISVPKNKADQARLGLAEKNLPMGGVVGWEIFDESKLGATDFDRRIQLIRAISGELSRTIRRIQAVEDARVQIVIPETRLFAEKVAPVTASVMLRLRPGANITPAKINGIIHLVASSVENLQTQNVTVVDNTGRILTGQALKKLKPRIVTKPIKVEPVPEPKVTKITSPEPKVVATKEAKPKVVAKVTTTTITATTLKKLTHEEKIVLMVKAKRELEGDLAGKAQEILNRFYPPNSAIVKINVDIKNGNRGKKFTKDELKVAKLSAIILVDNRVDINKNLKSATFKAVAAAIGYNRKRGDKIVMQKVPFHLATPPPEVIKGEVEKAMPTTKKRTLPLLPASWLRNIAWTLGIIGSGFVLIVVFRRFKRNKPAKARVDREAPVPAKPAAGPAMSREKMNAISGIKSAVERNPEKIAELLRNWLSE